MAKLDQNKTMAGIAQSHHARIFSRKTSFEPVSKRITDVAPSILWLSYIGEAAGIALPIGVLAV